MLEQFAALFLPIEAIEGRLIAAVLTGQDLDGDLLLVRVVNAQIDRAHAAFAEPAQDAIVAEPGQLRCLRFGARRFSDALIPGRTEIDERLVGRQAQRSGAFLGLAKHEQTLNTLGVNKVYRE